MPLGYSTNGLVAPAARSNDSMIDPSWLQKTFPDLSAFSRLGKGGQKEVFAAEHKTEGAVVVKIFHVGADRERALREVRVSLDLAGAKIPQTFDTGTAPSPTGEVLWIREQLVSGVNLRERLQDGPLDDEEVISACRDLLEVLAAAEEINVVHRDVKPENIIVADDSTFWLIDFGLGRHLDLTSITATGLLYGVGTPGYAPPEQFRNRKHDIDGRADLFGLGVTLFEAIEGANPLRAGARDRLEILRRTETTSLPRISRDIQGADGIADLLHTMTRARLSHRPESVGYALDWLREILNE